MLARQLAHGLSSEEASARLLRYGPNAIRTQRVSAVAVLGRQLRSALLALYRSAVVRPRRQHLAGHPDVAWVSYAGLPTSPGYHLA